MKAKRCSLCGGMPEFVYYAPNKEAKEVWQIDEDGEDEPLVLFKRVQCSSCKATTPSLVMTCDDAVGFWNQKVRDGKLVIPYSTEMMKEVEQT